MGCECKVCGEPLDAEFDIDSDGGVFVKVEPCEGCMIDKYDIGVSDGYDQGKDAAEESMVDSIDDMVKAALEARGG